MRNERFRHLIFSGLLVSIGIVLSYVIVFAYPPGQVHIKIGIGWLPLMLISMFFGPGVGVISGVAQDVLGYFVFGTGTGPYFFGFTFNAMIVGFLPWVIIRIKTKKINLFLYLNYVLLLIILAASVYLLLDINQMASHTSISITWDYIILILNVLAALAMGVFVFVKRSLESRAQQIIFFVTILMILVSIVLTPVWLNIMYKLPYLPQLPLRIVKLPLEVFVYSVLLIEFDKRFGKMIKQTKSA